MMLYKHKYIKVDDYKKKICSLIQRRDILHGRINEL